MRHAEQANYNGNLTYGNLGRRVCLAVRRDADRRVLRGGFWVSDPDNPCSARRSGNTSAIVAVPKSRVCPGVHHDHPRALGRKSWANFSHRNRA